MLVYKLTISKLTNIFHLRFELKIYPANYTSSTQLEYLALKDVMKGSKTYALKNKMGFVYVK